MFGKSASVPSLPKRYQSTSQSSAELAPPLKLSQYQRRMKKFYDDLNKRAYEATKKDREVVDHLNDWRYCDPDNQVEELPQPYRGINEIIQDDILNELWIQISKVELSKKDPSYDGTLPKLQPSGEISTSSIKGISAITEATGNPKKHLFIGDNFANIYIFDPNKKQVISKYDCLPDKRRIQSMSAQVQKIQGVSLVTLAVLQHGSVNVTILRYIVGENTLSVQFKIVATSLAYAVELSPYHATFCALTHFNGNVSVYKIPEPPIQQMPVVEDDTTSHFSKSNSHRGSPRILDYKLPEKKQEQAETLVDYYTIEFKGIKRERTYDNVVKDIQKSNDVLRASILGITIEEYLAKDNPIPQEVPQAAAKKETKKPGKGVPEVAKPVEPPLTQELPSILKNTEVQSQSPTIDGLEGDISLDIPLPIYQPRIIFQSEKFTAQNKDKLFNKPYASKVTTGILIAWLNTKDFSYHRLQEPVWTNLPSSVQLSLLKSQDHISQKKEESSAKSSPPRQMSEFQHIYPITSIEMSTSEKYVAFGLSDGNIILWDNEYRVQKQILEAHQAGVTCLKFFYEKTLVSGCKNGEILFNVITNSKNKPVNEKDEENRSVCLQNTYNQRKDNTILALQINKYGLVSALDSKGNARFYNVHLKKKIAQIIPTISFENILNSAPQKPAEWKISPQPLFFMSKESDQLFILSQEETEQPIVDDTIQEQKTKKTVILQIYKLADNLASIYEGIKNLIRNGVQSDQINFQFTQMSIQQLTDKNYSIQSALESQQQQNDQQFTIQSSRSKKNSIVGENTSNDLSFSSKGDHRESKVAASVGFNVLNANNHPKVSLRLSHIPKKSLPSLNSMRDSLFGSPSIPNRMSIMKNAKNGLTDMKLHPEKYMWKQQFPTSEFYDPVGSSLEMARERASNMYLLENHLSKSMVSLEKSLQHKEEVRVIQLEQERRKQLAGEINKRKAKPKSLI